MSGPAPANLSGYGVDGGIFLSWNDTISADREYTVTASTGGATVATKAVTIKPVNELTTDISGTTAVYGLTNGTAYTVSVTYTGGDVATISNIMPRAELNSSPVLGWNKQDATINTTGTDGYDNSTNRSIPQGICMDNSGNIFITYRSNGTISGLTTNANFDIVVAKLDPSGNRLWAQQRTISTSATEIYPAIATDGTDAYVIYSASSGGSTAGNTSLGGSDIVVLKLNGNDGSIAWIKQDGTISSTSNDQTRASIAVDKLNNVYITYPILGTLDWTIAPDASGDLVITRLNASTGDTIWALNSSSLNTSGGVLTPYLAVDPNNNVIVSYIVGNGAVSGGTNVGGPADVVVAKLNSAGAILWVKQDNTMTTSVNETGPVVTCDPAGYIYLIYEAGSGVISGGTSSGSTSQIVLVKLDHDGNRLWAQQQALGGSSGKPTYYPSICVDKYGNIYYYVQKDQTSLGLGGRHDVAAFKLNSTNGSIVWAFGRPNLNDTLDTTTQTNYPYGITCKPDGSELYILYDALADTSGNTTTGGRDIVAAKILQKFSSSAPLNVSASQSNSSDITISWSAPTDQSYGTVTQYKVSWTNGSDVGSQTLNASDLTSGLTYTLTNRTIASTYTITVSAFNGTVFSTGTSATVALNGIRGPATPTLATAGNGELRLSWAAPSALGYTITDYELLDAANDTVVATVAAPALTYTFTELGAATKSYKVRAKDAAANVTSTASAASASVATKYLETPVLDTIERSHMELELTWTTVTSQSVGTVTYTLLDESGNILQSSVTSPLIINTGLTAGQSYTYKIRANGTGLSTESNTKSAIVPFVPVPVPTTPTLGNAQATIGWNNVSAQVQGGTFQGYKIYYRKDGFDEYVTSLISETTTTITGLSGGFGNLTINETAATFAGLTNGALYKFRIVSVVSIDGITYDSTSSSIIRAIPIAPTLTVTDLATSLVSSVTDSDATTAVAAVDQLVNTSGGATTAAGSFASMASGTTTQQAAAATVFVGLPTVSAAAVLQALLTSQTTSASAPALLQEAVTSNAPQVASTISALSTAETRKEAIAAAVKAVVDANTATTVAAAVNAGIVTDTNTAKAAGAAGLAARITVTAVKTNISSVVTNFSAAITEAKALTTEQKTNIIAGAAEELVKTSAAVVNDVAATSEEKAAAKANAVVAVLKEANAGDADATLKNTFVAAIKDNFAGATIPLSGDARSTLLSSIPAERIQTDKLAAEQPITVVVPTSNEVVISTTTANQFLAMELNTLYTFKNAANTSQTIAATYKQDAGGARYLEFGSGSTLNLGGYIDLFGARFFLAAAANPIMDPATTPSAPTITSVTAGSTSLTVNFTAGADGGSTITNYMYSTNGGNTFTAFSPAQTTSPLTISGLSAGTYSVKIKAVTTAYPEGGEASNAVSATIEASGGGGGGVPCIVEGQRILTPTGYKAVETLRKGDYIVTPAGKQVPVRVYRTVVESTTAKTAPVRVAGPKGDVLLSPLHAYKVNSTGWMLPGIAVAAQMKGVNQEPLGKKVVYYHVETPNYLQDDLVVEGLVVESFGYNYVRSHGIDARMIYTRSANGLWYERMAPIRSKSANK